MSPKVKIDNSIPEQVLIRRSWRERLFSWPWLPFQAFKIRKVYYVYQYSNGKFRMNSKTYHYLYDKKNAIDALKKWDKNDGENSSPSKHDN